MRAPKLCFLDLLVLDFLLGQCNLSNISSTARLQLSFCVSHDIWIYIYRFARLILVDVFI